MVINGHWIVINVDLMMIDGDEWWLIELWLMLI